MPFGFYTNFEIYFLNIFIILPDVKFPKPM
jgi:hypothetical protein